MSVNAADRVSVHHGDSREVLRTFAADSFDSCVTDPPYALVSIAKRFGKANSAPAKGNAAYMRASRGFMGQAWDNGETAFDPEFWREVYRVLKPGAHLVAFSGTRTYHRMVCAIEDAGFEIRDTIAWLYGSGFPKSHDVAKTIDKRGGHYRGQRGMPIPFRSVAKGQEYVRTPKGAPVLEQAQEWEGWGTALKPALEPIVLARKPLIGTVAENVLQHGTGALNIDACRVDYASHDDKAAAAAAAAAASQRSSHAAHDRTVGYTHSRQDLSPDEYMSGSSGMGRWPANIVHDGSAEVLEQFPESDGQQAIVTGDEPSSKTKEIYGEFSGSRTAAVPRGDVGSAARFFYTSKADADDRLGSKHPTVKPVDLIQWLVRLTTRRGGTVLDPFAGTGTTGEAAFREGCKAVLIEREERFVADINRRISLMLAGRDERARESIKARGLTADAGPLFGGAPEANWGGATDLRSLLRRKAATGRAIGPTGLRR